MAWHYIFNFTSFFFAPATVERVSVTNIGFTRCREIYMLKKFVTGDKCSNGIGLLHGSVYFGLVINFSDIIKKSSEGNLKVVS